MSTTGPSAANKASKRGTFHFSVGYNHDAPNPGANEKEISTDTPEGTALKALRKLAIKLFSEGLAKQVYGDLAFAHVKLHGYQMSETHARESTKIFFARLGRQNGNYFPKLAMDSSIRPGDEFAYVPRTDADWEATLQTVDDGDMSRLTIYLNPSVYKSMANAYNKSLKAEAEAKNIQNQLDIINKRIETSTSDKTIQELKKEKEGLEKKRDKYLEKEEEYAQVYRNFKYAMLVTMTHEVAHLLIMYIQMVVTGDHQKGRAVTPEEIDHMDYGPAGKGESGAWIELKLFGGDLQFSSDPVEKKEGKTVMLQDRGKGKRRGEFIVPQERVNKFCEGIFEFTGTGRLRRSNAGRAGKQAYHDDTKVHDILILWGDVEGTKAGLSKLAKETQEAAATKAAALMARAEASEAATKADSLGKKPEAAAARKKAAAAERTAKEKEALAKKAADKVAASMGYHKPTKTTQQAW
ncbi:hypothetical protein N7462_000003 [Penicillium macrosclerotiorum]|uniref:uncharacterized protein n=1 Tax=Penicillium macrosclerotiorum TaxID=303699 RepID=UPI0025476E10|nr:uncharacterized protein N7462_000003 [Penicillium macrosclerotiorum]KAJ5697998.1 hypothetical protein N7462_000003 [Penicillium macrosclerotiorum]